MTHTRSRLDAEVMQPGASSYHEQACGSWLASGITLSGGAEYLSFADASERKAAVQKAEAAAAAQHAAVPFERY